MKVSTFIAAIALVVGLFAPALVAGAPPASARAASVEDCVSVRYTGTWRDGWRLRRHYQLANRCKRDVRVHVRISLAPDRCYVVHAGAVRFFNTDTMSRIQGIDSLC